MRSGIGNNAFLIAIIASLLIATRGHMAEASSKKAVTATKTIRTTKTIKQVIEKRAVSVQLVSFPDTGWNPVKVVRGRASAKSGGAVKPEVEKAETAEIVMFGDSLHGSVRVVR